MPRGRSRPPAFRSFRRAISLGNASNWEKLASEPGLIRRVPVDVWNFIEA